MYKKKVEFLIEVESYPGDNWALCPSGLGGEHIVWFNPFNQGDELPFLRHWHSLRAISQPSYCDQCAERMAWLAAQEDPGLKLKNALSDTGRDQLWKAAREAEASRYKDGWPVLVTPPVLPTDWQERKDTPMATGFLDYFPLAIAEVARVSVQGSKQHHPDEPLHWDKDKSTDHADCIMRHLVDRGKLDTDGQRHSAKVAWRAMALLELELEAALKEKTDPGE